MGTFFMGYLFLVVWNSLLITSYYLFVSSDLLFAIRCWYHDLLMSYRCR